MEIFTMSKSILSIISLVIICEAKDQKFNCKPRRGCAMPRCDPLPVKDPAAALERNEYPIVCVNDDPAPPVNNPGVVTRREYSALLNSYAVQRRTMNALNVDMAALRFRFRRLENSTKFSNVRLQETELSLRKLEQNVSKLRNEKSKLRQELEEMKKMKPVAPPSGADQKEIKALQSSITSIYMIVAELKRKNLELEKDIKELATTKAPTTQRTDPRRRTSTTPVTRRRQPPPPTTRRTTTPRWQPPPIRRATTARTTVEMTRSSPDDSQSMTSPTTTCESILQGVCVFLITKNARVLDFEKSRDECQKHDAFSALITSQDLYNAVLKFVRTKKDGDSFIVWTGMIYNPVSGKMTRPFGAYVKWAAGAPRYEGNAVVLRVSLDQKRRVEGMINIDPYVSYNNVLCQRWIA